MIEFNPKELGEDRSFKLLLGSMIPRPIGLITTSNTNGTINTAPFSFINVVSPSPALISVAIQRNSSILKDTAYNLINQKEAVMHMIHKDSLEESYQTAANLPYGSCEIVGTSFKLINSNKIKTPGIDGLLIRFETTLYQHIEINEDNDLFLLEIVNMYFDEKIFDNGRINFDKFQGVGALVGNQFIEFGKKIIIEDDNFIY